MMLALSLIVLPMPIPAQAETPPQCPPTHYVCGSVCCPN